MYKKSDVRDLIGRINYAEMLFADTETSKLGSQIRLVQLYQESWDDVLVIEVDKASTLMFVWDIIVKTHSCWHNGIYDFNCFKKDLPEGAFQIPKNWEDTFYLSRLAYPEWNTGNGYSLDSALTQILGYDPYAKRQLNKKQLQMSFERIKVKGEYVEGPDGLRPLTEEQLLYGSVDVYELPHLYHAVKQEESNFVYQLDKRTVATILKDSRGMPVDLDRLKLLEEADISNVAKRSSNITINPNSYMQVRKALGTIFSSDEASLQVIAHRPKGLEGYWTRIKIGQKSWPKAIQVGLDEMNIQVETRSFGERKRLSCSAQLPRNNKILVYATESSYTHTQEKVDLALNINSMRKSLKRLNFVKRAHTAIKDGRITATFSPHAINGRIQQDNENLTQYPRAMKSMWGHPPGNGRKLMYSDFAQIELRLICALLPEMNMYKALKDGEDLHSFVAKGFNFSAEEIAALPAGQKPRQIAKQANFLMLYGGGEANFQKTVCKDSGVWFSEAATHKIITRWKSIFSDITNWHKRNSRKRVRQDSTVCGRPYVANSVTDLNNIKVSGSGSEVFKLWLVYIDEYLLKNDIYIVNRVHDSVTLDVPDDPEVYIPLAQNLALLAQKAWFEIIQNAALIDVPMPCDVAVGSNMADIEAGMADYSYVLDPYYMLNKEIKDVIRK